MNEAVFLDRDGVLNELVYNPATGEYESPHHEKDLKLFPWSLLALKRLSDSGYLLFLVSNQPSYAKGKTSLRNIKSVHHRFHASVSGSGAKFSRYYYCYHHPRGIKKGYSFTCSCRKPKPYFLLQARKRYDLDMGRSWFIGDRDTDVQCGQAAGTRTILIREARSRNKQGESRPDHTARDLKEAVAIILKDRKKREKEAIHD